jgi:uncharacterized membrane protein
VAVAVALIAALVAWSRVSKYKFVVVKLVTLEVTPRVAVVVTAPVVESTETV